MIAEELKLIIKAEADKAIREMKQFRTQTDKAKVASQSMGSVLSAGVAKFAAVSAAIYGVIRAGKAVVEFTQYAAEYQQTEMAFENISQQAGLIADDVIKSMQKMSGETVNQLDLMAAANRAAILGIPMDKLDELMQIARASSTALGGDITTMFDDIVTGIGRGSKMILDNLGIVFSAEEAYRNYAEKIGKSVTQLSESEKKQAFLNETLKEGQRIMEQVGDAGLKMTPMEPMQKFQAAVADLKAQLGSELLPAVNAIATALAGWIRKLIDSKKAYQNLQESLKEIKGQDFEATAEGLIKINEAIKETEEKLGGKKWWAIQGGSAIKYTLTGLEKRRKEIEEVIGDTEKYTEAIDGAVGKENEMIANTGALIIQFKNFEDSIRAVNTELNKMPTMNVSLTNPTANLPPMPGIGEKGPRVNINVEGSVISEQELEGLVINTVSQLTRGY